MISIKNCSIEAGAFKITGINMEVPLHGYGVLMGKTGTGKTTILEAICGLRKVAAGTITINGEDITARSPAQRKIGFLPQDIALFDHMSVYHNIAFGMKVKKVSRKLVHQRVQELAEQLQLTSLLKRMPVALSGGEQQRTAIARALAIKPHVLCLDEPLNKLDDDTHEETIQLIKQVTHESGVTSLHITHRKSEATSLGDHFFKLRDGQVIKTDHTFT
jgi:ABC-type sugar transport system ATPase subunit